MRDLECEEMVAVGFTEDELRPCVGVRQELGDPGPEPFERRVPGGPTQDNEREDEL